MSSWLRGYAHDWKYSTCLFSSNSLWGESKVGVGETLVRDAFEQSGRSVGVHRRYLQKSTRLMKAVKSFILLGSR